MASLELASPDGGLTQSEVRQRIQAGLVNEVQERPSRTTGEIVRANVVTRFNILPGGLLRIVPLAPQSPRDALFGPWFVTNSAIWLGPDLPPNPPLERLELSARARVRLYRQGL